jgi:hypothetical protein
VKIQLRNQSRLRMPTPLGERKAAFGTTAIAMGGPKSPESLAQGMFPRISHEPRRAHHLRSQEWKDGRQGKPEATEDGWTSSLMTP